MQPFYHVVGRTWFPEATLGLFPDEHFQLPFKPIPSLRSNAWKPAVDIYDVGDRLILKAELPGFNQKNIAVSIEDGTLILKGERKLEENIKQDQYHRIERAYGSFSRAFALPEDVDTTKTSAEYKDGVLTIMLPKKAPVQPKPIEIKVI
jgi:HSP20 family protein